MSKVYCNACRGNVNDDTLCEGHEITIPVDGREPQAVTDRHVIVDHHRIGSVNYASGPRSLYCDGLELVS